MYEQIYRQHDAVLQQIAQQCPWRAAEMKEKRKQLWESYRQFIANK